MAIVLDASAAVAVVLDTPAGQHLKTRMKELNEEIIAPDLFMSECANGLWKYVHCGYMKHEEAWTLFQLAVELPNVYYTALEYAYEAFNEAVRKDHPAYDMAYLVLARRTMGRVATCDKRFKQLCEQEGLACL